MRHEVLALIAIGLVPACRAQPNAPLTRAAAAGDAAQVQAQTSRGIDVDARDGSGWAASHWAARHGHVETLAALIAAGADVDLADGRRGWTPLLHAVHKRQAAAVRFLLEAGADPNLRARVGERVAPLLMAAGYGQTAVVEALLDHGADPYVATPSGRNALWAAAGGGAVADFTDGPPLGSCFPDTVRLLERRAPRLRLAAGGQLLFWLARSPTCRDLVARLRASGSA